MLDNKNVSEARNRENSTSVVGTDEENSQVSHGVVVEPPEPPFWDLRRRRRKRFIATQPHSKYVDSIQAFDVSSLYVFLNYEVHKHPLKPISIISPVSFPPHTLYHPT